jgi:hypothetical protein
MDVDKSLLKNPKLWAVVIPVILGIWALSSTVRMVGAYHDASEQQQDTDEAMSNARRIATIVKRLGRQELSGDAMFRDFDRVTSARQCARAALIPENKLQRIESRDAKTLKDGSLLFKEDYQLNGVKLLQIATFIDYAERNYTSLNCTQTTLYPSRSKSKNSWDARVSFQYLRKES